MPGFVNYKKGCTRLVAASVQVYQLLALGRWFSTGTPASSTTKTGPHDIAEMLLKVALNNKNQIIILFFFLLPIQRLKNYLAFQLIYYVQRTWWRIFQKSILYSKFDIRIFIIELTFICTWKLYHGGCVPDGGIIWLVPPFYDWCMMYTVQS